MTYSVDFLNGGDYAVNLIHHYVQNGADGLGMGGHGDLLNVIIPAGNLVGQPSVNSDALAETLGEYLAGVGVHKLVFKA